MNKLIIILSILLLCACTIIRIKNENTIITAEKEKPFCDI